MLPRQNSPENPLKKIKFSLTAEELKKLEQINNQYSLGLILPKDESIHIAELENQYNRLCDIEEKTAATTHDRLLIKKYKLAILLAFEKHIDEKILKKTVEESKSSESFLSYWFKRTAFSVLLVTGLAMDGIGSFLGIHDMLTMLPFFSSPVAMGIGVFLSIINCALFYSFEAGLLKKAMNIPTENGETLSYDIDDQEIEATKRVNKKLRDQCKKKLDPSTFSALASLAGQFNKNITNKNKHFIHDPEEKAIQTLFRHTITVIGAIMQVSMAYFLSASLLGFIAAPLIGTPIGWALTGFLMLTSLSFFLAMRGTAVSHMFNPEKEKFDHVKNKLNNFEANPDFEKAYDTKQVKTLLQQGLTTKLKVIKRETALPPSVNNSFNADTSGNSTLLWKKNAPGKWEIDENRSEKQQLSNNF